MTRTCQAASVMLPPVLAPMSVGLGKIEPLVEEKTLADTRSDRADLPKTDC